MRLRAEWVWSKPHWGQLGNSHGLQHIWDKAQDNELVEIGWVSEFLALFNRFDWAMLTIFSNWKKPDNSMFAYGLVLSSFLSPPPCMHMYLAQRQTHGCVN